MKENVAIDTNNVQYVIEYYNEQVPFTFDRYEKTTAIPLKEENKKFLELMYALFSNEEIKLSKEQSATLLNWLNPREVKDNLANEKASSVDEAFEKLSFIRYEKEPVLEVKIVNSWYPIMSTIDKREGFFGSYIRIKCHAMLGGLVWQENYNIYDTDFVNEDGAAQAVNLGSLLKKRGIRVASKEAVENSRRLNKEILALTDQSGKVYDAWGTGMTYHNWWGFIDINVGRKESPTPVIVETLLENENSHRENNMDNKWHLPFVRVFSLKHKAYIYVEVDSMRNHTYQRDGLNKIVLPPKMFKALDSLFNAKSENVFGDLFSNRHGGIVILANGPSGVGKTLSAEVFAEYQERPLYSIEMSEIGTSVESVEENLQRIFARAKKWNAVLLFDEADIFLAERQSSDLERSAIVGIFLRLLDYYEGTFFLTTNRGNEIDKAFKSRVTLYLDYPELSDATRLTIWTSMVKSAGLNIKETVPWQEIATKKLNGRQIRNQVRLLKIMYPDGNLTTTDLQDSFEFVVI